MNNVYKKILKIIMRETMLKSAESSYFTFLRKENRDLKKENKNLKEDFNRLWKDYIWLSHVNNKLREENASLMVDIEEEYYKNLKKKQK